MNQLFLVRNALVFACAIACTACALPQAAPVASKVEEAASELEADYFLVPLLPPIVQLMGTRGEAGFPAAFHLAKYNPSIALKAGDVISVTIFEVGASPTFGSIQSPTEFVASQSNAFDKAKNLGDEPILRSYRSFEMTGLRDKSNVGGLNAQSAPKILVASNGAMPFIVAQTPLIQPQGAPAPQQIPPPTGQTTRTLPPLTVEADGDVLIPYAERVHVAGLTPNGAAEAIRDALVGKAVNPQVIVSFVSNGGNTATVGGEAASPRPIALSLRGERLLDAIGQAGGSKWPAPDTDVDIIRGARRARVRLQTIVENPTEDIVVKPNDQIFLTHDPRSFTVLGASQKVSQYTFDVPHVSLAEAVGRAGGAVDTIGNPAAIYLFREEPTALAESVLQVSQAIKPQASDRPAVSMNMPRVKIVYKLNMNSGEGYFLAQKVAILDKDVILIANADGTQLLKLFTLARGVTGAISDLNIVGGGSSVR